MIDNTVKPLVSVIMPVYKAEKYIGEAISSVIAQTYSNWELLTVDDCTPDQSFDIVRSFAEHDSRIRILKNKKNCGAAQSRNNAIKAAKGEYIALLDSDDLWYPEKLEKQVQLAQKTKADILYTSYALMNENGVKQWDDYIVPESLTIKDMLLENLIGCLTVMVRANLLKEKPFSREYYHEDYAKWMELLSFGYKARGISEVLASYRIHSDSRSYNKWKVAGDRWDIYRRLLHLSLFSSAYYFAGYIIAGLKKYKKSNRKKISIIGHFGGRESFLDGQTIKTKILADELEREAGLEINRIDTYEKHRHPFKLLIRSIKGILSSDAVITMVHENGMKLYLPLLWFFAVFFKKKVYHDVIGGDLPNFVRNNKKYKKYLNSFQSNWVETEKLKGEMEAVGVKNCLILSNFKRLNLADEEAFTEKEADEVFRFCTFSRVIREKGVETAAEAVRNINDASGKIRCTLTIYGQVGKNYTKDFEKLQENFPEGVRYGGLIPYEKSTEVLKEYDALLFPTFWSGECFPGTIIDAYSAGIPVLASDWNSNREIIDDGADGFLFPGKYGKSLQEIMEYLMNHPEKLLNMKKESLKKASLYQPEMNIRKILAFMS